MNNKEKYDNYITLIKKREEDFITNAMTIPTNLYSIHNLELGVVTYIVSGFRYNNKANLITPYKITREFLNRVKQYYEAEPVLSLYNVLFDCYNIVNGIKLPHIIQYKELCNYFSTYEEAEGNLNGILERQKELLSNGNTRCDYCSKIVKDSEIIVGNISNYKQYSSTGKNFNFCSEECFKHKQMGSEG